MNIPAMTNQPIVDKDGKLTEQWRTMFAQLFQQMSLNLSDEGFICPSQTTDNINKIASQEKNGAVLYDSDTNELKACINGVFKTLTLATIYPNTSLISDNDGNIISGITTANELSYIHGVTSSVQSQLNNKEPSFGSGTTGQYLRGDKTWQTLNTSAVPENTNLYYTDNRARSSISTNALGLTYTSSTGVLSLTDHYVIAFRYTDLSSHSSVGAIPTNLATYTLPANFLVSSGDYIDIHGFGSFASNNNIKSLQLYIGSTLILDTLALPLNGGAWDLRVIFARVNATAQKATILAASSNLSLIAKSFFTHITEDLTTDVLIRFVATGVDDNDVVQEGLLCKVMG